MPEDQNYTPDIAEYMKKKRIFDPGLPTAMPDEPHAVVPVSTLPSNHPAMDAYNVEIANTPKLADYHMSKTRNILGRIAGGLAGLSGDAKVAAGVNRSIRYGPYEEKQASFQQGLGIKKQLADTEYAGEKQREEKEFKDAQAEHLRLQGIAESKRAGAEETRSALNVKKANVLAPDHDTAQKDALELAVAKQRPVNRFDNTPYTISVKGVDGAPDNKVIGAVRDPESGQFFMPGTKEPIDPKAIVGEPTKMGQKDPIEVFRAEQDLRHKDAVEMAQMHETAADKRQNRSIAAGQERVATAQANKRFVPTTATRSRGEVAAQTVPAIKDMRAQIEKVRAQLGPMNGRWNDVWTGKVGANNPEFMKLMADSTLLSSAIVNFHVGARGGKYLTEHFQKLLDQGKQDPDNMLAALDAIEPYMTRAIAAGKGEDADPTEDHPAATPGTVDHLKAWKAAQGVK